MPSRFVLLFARAPQREAREKGFDGRAGEELFALFARGWISAARLAGARLVVASDRADRAAWGRLLSDACINLIEQRGDSFGERLERAARDAGSLGGQVVIVGGDVAPSTAILQEAFEDLDRDADALLAPAPDGGVSLVALAPGDLDLLRAIVPRRRDVFSVLCERLAERGRRVRLVAAVPDVDGRRQLRSIFRSLPASLRAIARRALSKTSHGFEQLRPFFRLSERTPPAGLRAPPAAA